MQALSWAGTQDIKLAKLALSSKRFVYAEKFASKMAFVLL